MSAAIAQAQFPKVESIDFYGVKKTSRERLQKALGLGESERLSASKTTLEERLDKVSGVVASHVEAVCCENDGILLFVGVEEKGGTHFAPRSAPFGKADLPPEILEAYSDFTEAAARAAQAGNLAEDLTRGHSLMADLTARGAQERFVGLAELHIAALRKVLRESADEDQRTVAAFVIGYYPTKRLVVDDLQIALQDPSASVRANALRAFGAIAVLAVSDPELGIKVQPTWFIELLNSVVWSDRVKAVSTLLNLTDGREPRILESMKERSVESLIEMARWKSLRHAIGPFTLLGRMAGFPEEEIRQAWTEGDREIVIKKLRKDIKETKKQRDMGPPPLPANYPGPFPTTRPAR
ncbi:MAG: HEAT repeat domain-containing protein [Bryobacteraceae bacterium]